MLGAGPGARCSLPRWLEEGRRRSVGANVPGVAHEACAGCMQGTLGKGTAGAHHRPG